MSLSSPLKPLLCANAEIPVREMTVAATAEIICFFVISPHRSLIKNV